MRKYYLDNIRWITVVIVVFYHVFYMYNTEGLLGVAGRITNLEVQYYDVFQYIVYPWFMMLLFIVSGISARLDLKKHSDREFIRNRTRKLLVPSTIGLFAFQFLQGFVNVSLGGLFEREPDLPFPAKALICVASGVGALWYIQLLWFFSMLLIVVRKIEKDRLWRIGGRAGMPVLIAMVLPVFGAAQILNTPIILVYRFGLYFFVFLLGYFVFSHDEVIGVLKKWFPLAGGIAAVLGIAFCARYFGENYADYPANRSVLFAGYGYFACLAILGGMAEYGNFSSRFTQWMSRRSFGLYVFHYLGISSVGLFIGKRGLLPAPAVYFLSLAAGFAGGYLLYEIISRIPGYRWAVLGIKGNK
ncbi:MAG: acyltransferase [Eubacteriales bacterium]|nr:acyltransferase [Eubacteriales bacterium]